MSKEWEKKILVTGGSGFLGTNIIKFLARKDERVIATTRSSHKSNSLLRNYLDNEEECIEWAIVDVTDYSALGKIFEEYEIEKVVHAAFFTPGTGTIERQSSREILTSNILGTVNILELSKIYQVKNFVFISSSSVYGTCKHEYVKEDSMEISNIQDFYSISKITGEKLTARYSDLNSFLGTSLRFPVIYGPMERTTGSRVNMGPIYKIFKLVLEEKRKHLYVMGLEQKIDWVYVLDAALGIYNALKADACLSPVYNISYGERFSVKELLKNIMDITSVCFSYEEADEETADVLIKSRPRLSIDRAKRELGFSPRFNIRKGLEKYYNWWAMAVKNKVFIP